jgi:hypothetical protein
MGETCRRVELQIDDLAHAGLLAVLKEKNGNNPESLPFATFAPPLRPSRLRAFRNPGSRPSFSPKFDLRKRAVFAAAATKLLTSQA